VQTDRKVALIVLTWNQRELTLDCLDSLAALDYPAGRLEIIIVDNGSTDGTAQAVRARYPEVTVLENGENLGYAGGNNVGLRYAMAQRAEYVCILNNDVLVDSECLIRLVRVAESDSSAGLLGPKVYDRQEPGYIQSAGIMLDHLLRSEHRGLGQVDVGQFDALEEVDAVTGCAILVSRQMIDQIGLLDSRYFMYREEIDWCCRARDAGFKVLYVPGAKVWHPGAGPDRERLARITYYMTRNTYLLLAKRRAALSVFALVTLQNLLWLANWTLNPKWREKRESRDALSKAFVDALLGRYGERPYRYGL